MSRIAMLFFLLIACACSMKESSKKKIVRQTEATPSNRSIATDGFFDLAMGFEACPQNTFGSYEFLPEGLQFFCTVSEKNIRYTFTQRDTTIYKDPSFEFFFDPGADGLYYYEFQFNACPAVWDLKLKSSKGRINAPANMVEWDLGNNWEIKRIGSSNDDSDEDRLWSIYGIIPWECISEGPPQKGDVWAYNFMRVDYDVKGRPSYWAAFPTKKEMIHYPELWPTIIF